MESFPTSDFPTSAASGNVKKEEYRQTSQHPNVLISMSYRRWKVSRPPTFQRPQDLETSRKRIPANFPISECFNVSMSYGRWKVSRPPTFQRPIPKTFGMETSRKKNTGYQTISPPQKNFKNLVYLF